jgi:hypothetical protein
MNLGRVAMRIFPITQTLHPLTGPVLYILGCITALVFWGFGLVWLFFAVATIYKCKHFPFNMGWFVLNRTSDLKSKPLTRFLIEGGVSLSQSAYSPRARILWARNYRPGSLGYWER